MASQSERRLTAADMADFSTLLVPQLDSSADLAHFTFPFISSSPALLHPSFLPSTASTASSPQLPTTTESSSQVGDIFTPYNPFSFQDGLCPLSESPTLFQEQTSPVPTHSSTSRFSASRRKSKDLDKFLGLLPEQSTLPSIKHSTPAVGQSLRTSPSSSSFHFGRTTFVHRIGNVLKLRSRTTEDITPVFKTLNNQASRSTSALSAFDFGFDNIEETLSPQQETYSTSEENDSDLDEMGLMRSLTTRVKRSVEGDEQSGLMRGLTLSRKRPETPLEHIRSIKIKGRPKISLPTQIISTTNMASYHAPSVQDMRVLSQQQAAGYASSPLSDTNRPVSRSGSEHSRASSEPSLTDASSVSSRSFQEESVSPTDTGRGATDYFDVKPVDTPATSCEATPCSTPERKSPGLSQVGSDAPAIPQRAPSHSKREHVRLARHRSVRSSLRAASLKLESMTEGVVPSPMGPMAPASVILSRPFSAELAQLSEAVEEFASIAATKDEEAELAATSVAEDDAYLSSKGLARCSAQDYLDVIQPLALAFAEAIEA